MPPPVEFVYKITHESQEIYFLVAQSSLKALQQLFTAVGIDDSKLVTIDRIGEVTK